MNTPGLQRIGYREVRTLKRVTWLFIPSFGGSCVFSTKKRLISIECGYNVGYAVAPTPDTMNAAAPEGLPSGGPVTQSYS
jgi:hypothetical protein